MSGKRFNPLEVPPSASSSDEDDQVETTSLPGNSSSEDEADDEPSLKKPESAPVKHQASDSESGSDEETDSDSQTVRVKKNPGSSSDAKSIAGTKDSVVVKNHDSKKVKPLTKCSTKKRSLSETDGAAAAAASKEAKKVKSGGSGEEAKKTYFQRVWSEEDEIAVLQGLIDYRNDTGASPYDDTNAFYLSVKKSISFDVSKTQVIKKIWGLKTKYENNLGKEKNGEEELTFSKPHDRKAFDLSKFVWGADGVALDSAVKSNGKSKKSSKSKVEPEKVALDSANGKSKKSSKSSSKKVEPEKQELASSSSPNGKSCEEEAMTNKGEASSVVEVDAFEKSVLVKALARFGVDDLSAQQGWTRLALEDKKRFEEEWKVLQLRELEFYSKKSGFIHEVITKMAESFPPNP